MQINKNRIPDWRFTPVSDQDDRERINDNLLSEGGWLDVFTKNKKKNIKNQKVNKPNKKLANEEDNNTTDNSSRKTYSFREVFSFRHLLDAAGLCKRNVMWKASVQNFMRAVHFNCSILFYELHTGKFKFQKTNEFDICERGKRRHIKSIKIRDRVVQKVLCMYCLMPLFQPSFIYDNCASQKGKGISFAFRRLKAMLQKYYRQYGNTGYVLKFDFQDYFGSIDHDIVMSMISKKVTDKRLLNLTYNAMGMYSEDNKKVGLGLGSELSQFVALLFANPIDHHIKDKCGFKYYIRYMDDGIVICNDKKELQLLLKEMREICQELHLTLNENKTKIMRLDKGFIFLKKRIILTESGKIIMKLSNDTITRMKHKLRDLAKKLENNEINLKHIEDAYVAWRGFVEQFDAYNVVKYMNEKYNSIYGYIPISKKDAKHKNIKANKKRFAVMCEMAEAFFDGTDTNPYLTYMQQYDEDIFNAA